MGAVLSPGYAESGKRNRGSCAEKPGKALRSNNVSNDGEQRDKEAAGNRSKNIFGQDFRPCEAAEVSAPI